MAWLEGLEEKVAFFREGIRDGNGVFLLLREQWGLCGRQAQSGRPVSHGADLALALGLTEGEWCEHISLLLWSREGIEAGTSGNVAVVV